MDECQDVSIKSSIVLRYLAADQVLVLLLLLLLLVLLQGCHARACESQKQGRDYNVSSRARRHRGRSIEIWTMRGSKEMK